MKILKTLLFVLSLTIFVSCNKTLNFSDEKEYITIENDIVYYKGTPFNGVINKDKWSRTIVEYTDYNLPELGQFTNKESYKDGKKNGQWIYSDNWEIFEVIYTNGILNGKFTNYFIDETKENPRSDYLNNQISKTGFYKNNLKDGDFKHYCKKGTLTYETSYLNGITFGESKNYDCETGELTRFGSYENGRKTGKWFFKGEEYNYLRPNPKLEDLFFRKRKNTFWNILDENEIMSVEGNYSNGLEDGLFIGYYENGEKSWEGNFKEGKKEGTFTFYFKNGNIRLIQSFSFNKEIGPFTLYFENDDEYIKGILNDNGVITKMESFDKNGNLIDIYENI